MKLDVLNLSESELKELQFQINGCLKQIRKEKFNYVDIFCGAGGLSCGLEQAGLNCLLGVDIDPTFIKTFAYNHPYSKTFCGPIEKLTRAALKSLLGDKKIHLVAGGPPCQGFSTIGKGNIDDPRNSLFLQYCRMIKIIQPDYILFENVTGILSKKNESTLSTIFSKFKSLGYEIDIRVLEAQKFGVPQKRKRAFILGYKIGSNVNFPKSTHDIEVNNQYIPPKTVGDALENLIALDGEIYNHELKYTTILDKKNYGRLELIPEGKGIRYKKDEDAYFSEELKLNVDWENISEHRLREEKFHRFDRKQPAPTIMTRSPHYFHPKETRRFTMREFASFQSFPNEYYFCGCITSQQKQIGNAVPPLLAKHLGKEIINSIKADKSTICDEKLLKKQTKKIIADVRKNAFKYH